MMGSSDLQKVEGSTPFNTPFLGGSGEAPGQETAIAPVDGWTVILDEQCRFE
jgi:hypothetical protein